MCIRDRYGYHTVFLQSAPLGYMSKDLFASKAGFTDWLGANEIETKSKVKSAWGVDDKTLYSEAVKRIGEFRKPYFLSLLTTSTHPPYDLPNSSGDKEQAFRYASKQLARFIDNLKRKGLNDNTLILITSDESSASKNLHPLASNRGFMLALSTNIKPKKLSRIHGLVDIPKSVISYIGQESDFHGTSLFDFTKFEDRRLFAAHSFDNKLYLLRSFEEYIHCSHQLNCFDQRNNLITDPNTIAKIRNVVNKNDIWKVNDNELAKIKESSFVGSDFYTLLGRFISGEAIGSALELTMVFDTEDLIENGIEVTWVTFDCASNSPKGKRQFFTIPSGVKGLSLIHI